MKTTIDIPEDALEEVIRLTGAKTKREAVLTAIFEFNRRRRLARLTKRFGTFEGFVSNEDLTRQRSEE